MPGAQTYQLLIVVERRLRIEIGCLGVFRFEAGRYVYTGSAKRNLAARLHRHLAAEKRLHWHIDYLLAAPGVQVVDTRVSAMAECVLHQTTPGAVTVPRFGAGDCRAGCGSHLKYLGPSCMPGNRPVDPGP